MKNHHVINGISCQDMATSPMRPHVRRRQSWIENKENKPSPLIEVPPLGPTPMFANSNVSVICLFLCYRLKPALYNVTVNRLT